MKRIGTRRGHTSPKENSGPLLFLGGLESTQPSKSITQQGRFLETRQADPVVKRRPASSVSGTEGTAGCSNRWPVPEPKMPPLPLWLMALKTSAKMGTLPEN